MYRPLRAETIQAMNEGLVLLFRWLRPGGMNRYAARTHPCDPFMDQQYVPISKKPGVWAVLVRLFTLGAYGRTWAWVDLPPGTWIPEHVNCRCTIIEKDKG